MKTRDYAPSTLRVLKVRHQIKAMPHLQIVAIFFVLLLPLLACGFANPKYQTNNAVRLAVYEYEREVRGKTDDLVLDFNRSEPRITFAGQNLNGGRTVWLYRLGAEEFFALRPAERTYLYVQKIEYNDDRSGAAVTVYRGDGQGYQGRILTVIRDDKNRWSISAETEISGTP